MHRPLALLALAPSVLAGGERIYFGRVFGLATGTRPAAAPSFIYERRVTDRAAPSGDLPGVPMRSTHITRDAQGKIVVADSALHTAAYDLIDYQLYGNQLGQSGSVQVRGQRVRFNLHSMDGSAPVAAEQIVEEEQSAPVVVGPTLVGFIARQRARLEAGNTVAVRLAVLERLETLGFALRRVPAAPGQLRVEMAASNPLIGLAVNPLYFTFDSASGKLLRMEGRVPPKTLVGEHWQDLDARVEYSYVAAAYR